ncbi:MAG: hypothetical protein GC145_14195 [Caulobacter sp.]|nr:hypothetical protein [Caulobacter sp.]
MKTGSEPRLAEGGFALVPEAIAIALELDVRKIVPRDSGLSELFGRKVSRAIRTMKFDSLSVELSVSKTWLRHAALAIGYSVLTDFAYDETLPPGREIRVHQAASYLLSALALEASIEYGNSIHELMLTTISEHSQYHIIENRWSDPGNYIKNYGNVEEYYKKQSMYLFPVDLIAGECGVLLSNLCRKYFIYQLLADDISDFADDTKNKQISYAVMKYFKREGEMPVDTISRQDIVDLVADELKVVKGEVNNLVARARLGGFHYGDRLLDGIIAVDRIIYR